MKKQYLFVTKIFLLLFLYIVGTPLVNADPPPYDDTGLAPAGYSTLLQLPTNLPVFNVKTSYGATGDGTTNDLPAIRNAIAAAEAANGGIVFFPMGTYAMEMPPGYDPNNWPALITITKSNIILMGEGPDKSHLVGWMPGHKAPANYCMVTGDGYMKISRFIMVKIGNQYGGQSINNTQIRSLDMNGNAGYTGNSTVGGVMAYGTYPAGTLLNSPTECDGWDMVHDGVKFFGGGDNSINNTIIFNTHMHDFRGEVIHGGGGGEFNVVSTKIWGANSSAVSIERVNLIHSHIGGLNYNEKVYNCLENFATSASYGTKFLNSSCKGAGNGLALLGVPGSTVLVENSLFEGDYRAILFSEVTHNVTIRNSTFLNIEAQTMIFSTLGLYPAFPTGYGDFLIEGNTFTNAGTVFANQGQWIKNLAFKNNTLNGGILLNGTFPGPLSNFGTFTVDGTVFNNNATGFGFDYWKDPNSIAALWTNSVRPSVGGWTDRNEGNWTNADASTPILEILPKSDVTLVNSHTLPIQYIRINPANYPKGFTTTIYQWSWTGGGSSNTWVLKADSTWNTFPQDTPIGNGTTIRVNNSGCFELVGVATTVSCNGSGGSNTYNLTITATNGTVTKSPSTTSYIAGTQVTLTPTPNSGYSFTGWSGDVTGSAVPLVLTMTGNRNVTANFAASNIPQQPTTPQQPTQPTQPTDPTTPLPTTNGFVVTLVANPSAGGTVTKTPDQAGYPDGTLVKFTATPKAGYKFISWSFGTFNSTANPVEIPINASRTVTANFRLLDGTLPPEATPTTDPNMPITPTTTPTNFTQDLKQGDFLTDVGKLQRFLNSNGFVVTMTGYGSPGYESNFFGAKTTDALKRFQTQYLSQIGLTAASGILDQKTRTYINSLNGGSAPVLPSTTPPTTPSIPTLDRDALIAQIRSQLMVLQQQLLQLLIQCVSTPTSAVCR